jgi:L-alanine-DL-glutamate epimerase-like enolase superfamily enzyme
MKIVSVAVTAFREERSGLQCLVEVGTGAGLVGVAIAPHGLRTQIEQAVQELLHGEDPRAVSSLWQRMTAARSRSGGALSAEAVAALDVALWDLKAKAQDEPLWRALGGLRPRVNVHAAGCDRAMDGATVYQHFFAIARSFGVRGGLLEIGNDADADLQRLEQMHRALAQPGIEPALMIDFAARFAPKDAIRRVLELESRFDLTWVEEPAERHDFLGLKRVSDGIRGAVCAGERVANLLPHLHHRALDVVQVDAAFSGITGTLQIADAAFGFELPMALSASPGNFHAHLGAVMPYCMSMEVSIAEPNTGVVSSDVRIEAGWAVAGDRAGNGLVIDRGALARAAP